MPYLVAENRIPNVTLSAFDLRPYHTHTHTHTHAPPEITSCNKTTATRPIDQHAPTTTVHNGTATPIGTTTTTPCTSSIN